MWRRYKFIVLKERSQYEKAALYVISIMTFWKKQNCGDIKKYLVSGG
jgi:hypothetical protein